MPKGPFAAVERRYKFRVPELYREMFNSGHFDPRNEDAWLTLSDFEWLTPQAMVEFAFLDWQAPHKTWFVPFAVSGRHDQWGWRTDWADVGEPPVVFCEWGPEGYAHAPDFRGFLYRMLLEEFSGAWSLEHVDDEKGKQTLARSVDIVLPHLPKPWAARIKKLAQKPWQKDDRGTFYVFPRSECEKIVAKDLAFAHLNEKFWQEEPPQRIVEERKAKAVETKKKATKKAVVPAIVVVTGPDKSGFGGKAAGETRADNGLEMALCWCPPGTFSMGSPANEPERGDDEDPVQVTLTQGFWLSKFQVTQREYEQFTGTLTGTFTSTGYMKDAVQGLDTSRFPVERVTWNEAVAACERLTKQERKAKRLPANWEYRLPTEAQWEYACRAGTTTATAFGDKLSSKQANFDGTSPYNRATKGPNVARPTPVGSYPANAWDLHDMHGNVYEFCRDAVAPKLPGGTDPEVLSSKPVCQRIVRGGGWRSEGASCRSAFRYGMINTTFDDVLGFRIACVRIA